MGGKSRELPGKLRRTAFLAFRSGLAGRHEFLKCVTALGANVFVYGHRDCHLWLFFRSQGPAGSVVNSSIPERRESGNRICFKHQTEMPRSGRFFFKISGLRSRNSPASRVDVTPCSGRFYRLNRLRGGRCLPELTAEWHDNDWRTHFTGPIIARLASFGVRRLTLFGSGPLEGTAFFVRASIKAGSGQFANHTLR